MLCPGVCHVLLFTVHCVVSPEEVVYRCSFILISTLILMLTTPQQWETIYEDDFSAPEPDPEPESDDSDFEFDGVRTKKVKSKRKEREKKVV